MSTASMCYEIEIEDYGIRDEDGLLETPGKAWILVSVEDGKTFFNGFKVDFLNPDTSMILVLAYAKRYQEDMAFRKAVNKRINAWKRNMEDSAEADRIEAEYYARRP